MVVAPNRDRLAERREATRQEILAAAWDVAHQDGLTSLTLRAVAVRVGMQPPSLYSHFASKNAVYDAMFEQGWRELLGVVEQRIGNLPTDPRMRLRTTATIYFDFAVADLPRHLIMDTRTLPDFTPSAEAYHPSLQCYAHMRTALREIGIRRDTDIDLYTALLGGLVTQQLANDPGGNRWRRLLPRAMDMYADALGLPARTSNRRKS